MMLPYPWSTRAHVAVVVVGEQPMVVLGDFHEKVLHAEGPMPMTIDILRTRLGRVDGGQMVVDKDHSPMVLALLKDNSVVLPRVARAKLVSLQAMEEALTTAGKRPDHVATIIHTYMRVAGPAPAAAGHVPAPADTAVAAALEAAAALSSTPLAAEAPQPSRAPASAVPAASALPAAALPAAAVPRASSSPWSTFLSFSRKASVERTSASQAFGSNPFSHAQRASTPKRAAAEVAGDHTLEDDTNTMPRDWPMELPELAWPPKALKEDYGLATLMPDFKTRADIPLAQEIEEFESWCKQPIHIGRGTDYANPVKQVTFEGGLDCVQGFMGFMFKVSTMYACEHMWNTLCKQHMICTMCEGATRLLP